MKVNGKYPIGFDSLSNAKYYAYSSTYTLPVFKYFSILVL